MVRKALRETEFEGLPPVEAYETLQGDEEAIEERLWPYEEAAPGQKVPISHWSHSSLMAYLRNPLAWYKRYVERVYDIPSTPSSIVGRAGHVALQHFYGGISKEGAIDLGMEYVRNVPDFEINFGIAKTKKAKKEKRLAMEREYLQVIQFYLARPPRHDVVDIEVKATANVEGFALPLKAVSDLVVRSKVKKGVLDIVDHKFVESFSKNKQHKTLFVMQALFNYYTVSHTYKKPVKRFLLYECKKTVNRDGKSQMRKYVIEYEKCGADFELFKQLVNDVTDDLMRRKVFLPNPSDMFEGENSFDIYRLGLAEQ
ncbi:MAG: PD-(D/E)XK nuclease family protein [Patescibacteria group bacterium]